MINVSDGYLHYDRVSKKAGRRFFHRLDCADVLRPGICIDDRGVFLAVPMSSGPRHRLAWIGIGRGGLTYSLDFLIEHAMYRPWDIDSRTYLECRRCGVVAGSDVPDFCGGFCVSRRSGDPIATVTRAQSRELFK